MSNPNPIPPTEIFREKILGVSFFNGTAPEAVAELNRTGGLLVCPASPALVKLKYDEGYRRALQEADLALADSNLLVLLWKLTAGRRLRNVSGLSYLKCLFSDPTFRSFESVFWVVSSRAAIDRLIDWLRARDYSVDPRNVRTATATPDYELLQGIESRRPNHVVIAITGAQEELGLYLRDYLLYRPKIHCAGAALGFLTGAEHPIPEWADRLHLGWLFRSLAQPGMIIPRLGIACVLAAMVLKYREKLPPRKNRWADL